MLDALMRSSWLTTRNLADRAGLSVTGASHSLGVMEREGKVEKRRSQMEYGAYEWKRRPV